jgi:hypothetical protein
MVRSRDSPGAPSQGQSPRDIPLVQRRSKQKTAPKKTGGFLPDGEEPYRLFRDICFDAVTEVFPTITGEQMLRVREALEFCIPRWQSLINEGEMASTQRNIGPHFVEYEYYSEYEEEEYEG